jgi:hypothetical protein
LNQPVNHDRAGVTVGDGLHWLLIRRQICDGELAFYRTHAPARCRWPSWYT